MQFTLHVHFTDGEVDTFTYENDDLEKAVEQLKRDMSEQNRRVNLIVDHDTERKWIVSAGE